MVADVVEQDYSGQTQPILAGAVSGDDDQLAPPNTAAGRASAIAPRPAAVKRVVPEPEPLPKPKSRKPMFVAAAIVALLALVGAGIGYHIVRGYYYVSAQDDTVAIMRGVPGSTLGLTLHEPYLVVCINAHGEASEVSYGQRDGDPGCAPMRMRICGPPSAHRFRLGFPPAASTTPSTRFAISPAIRCYRSALRRHLLRPPRRARGSPPAPPQRDVRVARFAQSEHQFGTEHVVRSRTQYADWVFHHRPVDHRPVEHHSTDHRPASPAA